MTPAQKQDVVQELGALLWALGLRGEVGLSASWAVALMNDLIVRHRFWGGGGHHGLAVALRWLWRQVTGRGWNKLQVTSYAARMAAEERQ